MNGITQIFFGSLMVAFTGALMPGPMFTLVITSVAKKGFWTSVFIVVGHSILELLIVISFYLGILKYLDNPLVVKIISILGGAFLIYMAADIIVSILRKKVKLDLDTNKKIAENLGTKNTFVIVGKGILISLANPYWYIWWVTIGATFMLQSVAHNIGGVSAFYTGHILADFIYGYTIINDITARDLQKNEGQWFRAKSFDTFAPIGPVIVPSDAIEDAQNLNLKSYVNGELRQNSNTSEMIFKINELISFISFSMTLDPGDLIATGTPAGVGIFSKEKKLLNPGDKIVCEIEKIGQLLNEVSL